MRQDRIPTLQIHLHFAYPSRQGHTVSSRLVPIATAYRFHRLILVSCTRLLCSPEPALAPLCHIASPDGSALLGMSVHADNEAQHQSRGSCERSRRASSGGREPHLRPVGIWHL